jgi:diguanylate cyclase (GGDEF)-like protein/PAS domain S-box-containing protein
MSCTIPRVLCVDDEPKNLDLLEAMLLPRGYDVVLASNGQEALEKIKTEQIDICLLDVMMPGIDGFEVCRRIKSDDRYRNIPVVMITSYTGSIHRTLGIEAGAEDFISKPFDRFEVLARIKMLLEVKLLNDRLNAAREELFHIIASSAQDAILMLNEVGNITFWNEAAERIFGYTSEEIIGQNMHAILPPMPYREAHIRAFPHFQQTGHGAAIGKTLELSALRKDGSEFPLELSLSAVRVNNTWHSIGIVRDITTHKAVFKTLQNALEFQKVLMDAIPSPIFFKDLECKYTGGNKAFGQYIGFSKEQFIGKSVFDIAPPELAEKYYKADQEMFNNPGIYSYEASVSYADGTLHDVIFQKSTFLDLEGNLAGLIGIIVDVTEKNTLEKQLKKNIDELAAANLDVLEAALADVTLRKQLESEIQNALVLQRALEYAENIVETVREPLLVLDSSLKILSANSSFCSTFMVTAEETIGNFIYDLGSRQWDIPQLRLLLEEILPQETVLNGYEVDHDFLGIGRKTILLNARQIFREDIGSCIILLAMEDITERKLAEKTLQEKNETISQLAVTDELTGLNNRRFFNESLAKAVSAARRHRQPLSLISIDIDHFKKVNDTFGHTMGDLVLKEFSRLLKMMVRAEDIACRWGGEEFIVLLPNTTSEGAVVLADRMRSSFEQYTRTATPVVTASFGVARLQEGEDADALMRRVDAALYQAKHEGRNRVVAASDAPLA